MDSVYREAVIDAIHLELDMIDHVPQWVYNRLENRIKQLQSAQSEDYTELKREFLRMASYIDVLLECSDEQKETLMGFISRLAEFMPWMERD